MIVFQQIFNRERVPRPTMTKSRSATPKRRRITFPPTTSAPMLPSLPTRPAIANILENRVFARPSGMAPHRYPWDLRGGCSVLAREIFANTLQLLHCVLFTFRKSAKYTLMFWSSLLVDAILWGLVAGAAQGSKIIYRYATPHSPPTDPNLVKLAPFPPQRPLPQHTPFSTPSLFPDHSITP